MDGSAASDALLPLAVLVGNRLGGDPAEALRTARLADALGFRELWIGELTGHDAFAAAVAVALSPTEPARDGERATLTVGPLPVAVRDPVTVARGAASVADLTGRRVRVVLHAASSVIVTAWHGRSREKPMTALAETIDALRGLLTGERVDFDGTMVATRGYRSALPPSRAEITVMTFEPDALAAAAQRADRIAVPLASVEHMARLHARVRYVAERTGRPPPRLAVWLPTAVSPTPAGSAQLRRALVPYLRAGGFGRMFTEAGHGDVVALARTGAHPRSLLAQMSDEMVAAVTAFGSPAHVRATIDEYRAVGVDQVVVVPVTEGDPDGRRTLVALSKQYADLADPDELRCQPGPAVPARRDPPASTRLPTPGTDDAARSRRLIPPHLARPDAESALADGSSGATT